MYGSSRPLVMGLIVMLAVWAVGVLGYMLAGWAPLDALYMVIITVFGVGYGEVHSVQDPALRVFTIVFIIAGCSALIYTLGGIFRLIMEGEINRALGRRRMTQHIELLSDHSIVCGYGRLGRVAAEELVRTGATCLVVDREGERTEDAVSRGLLAIEGDATLDATLEKAGVRRARALASVLPDDALNVFITLTARNLNPNLHIVARAENPATEAKLRQAGANDVVLPASIGALRVAHMINRPGVLELFDADELRGVAQELSLLGVEIEEYRVAANSALIGVSMQQLEASGGGGFMVVAVARADGKLERNPKQTATVAAGDRILLLGRRDNVPNLEKQYALSGTDVQRFGSTGDTDCGADTDDAGT